MQKVETKYKLPHEYPQWVERSKLLMQISQETNLQKSITFINQIHENNTWQQKTLTKFILTEERIAELLGFAAKCALQVDKLFPNGIPISHPITEPEGKSFIILTKRQALCLSTNMFFGTTCRQTDNQNMPVFFTFTKLTHRPTEVVKTYFNYLSRCQKEIDNERYDTENIVYVRMAQSTKLESWIECNDKLSEVRFHQVGVIEDLEHAIQIDFANKSIGGFFLCNTYTQEDNIFINNPELIPALLFHKYMKKNECILLIGAERYSLYQGYLDTYTFSKDYQDKRETIDLQITENIKVKVKDSWISAIDAIPFFHTSQFSEGNFYRELNKAYVGFNIMGLDGGNKVISTGNWGSGAFNGNLEYKFLIQWLAISRAHRTMDYFSFQHEQATEIPSVVKKFKHVTVGELTQILIDLKHKFDVGKTVFNTLMEKGPSEFQ